MDPRNHVSVNKQVITLPSRPAEQWNLYDHFSVNNKVFTLPGCPAELADGSQQTTIMLQTQITSEELKIEAKVSSHTPLILNLVR